MNSLIRCLSLPPIVAAAFLAGCETTGSTPKRPVYSASQTGQKIKSEAGIVVSAEEVLITGDNNAPGAPGPGAEIGRAVGVGTAIGSPGTIVGAIGGIFGSKAGATLDNKVGDKITIMTDAGDTVVVVQERGKDKPLMPGERVTVETGGTANVFTGNRTRVVRENPVPDPNYIAESTETIPKPKPVW